MSNETTLQQRRAPVKRSQRHGRTRGAESSLQARSGDLRRIRAALYAASSLCGVFAGKTIQAERKEGGDLVTGLDRALNNLLYQMLPRGDEGWLSEESADDLRRLPKRRVWIVDPLDGTKEFVGGLPEWCVSIALVEEGQAVAGGICNPSTGEIFIGSRETGIRCRRGKDAGSASNPRTRPLVLASRSESARGEWDWLKDAPFEVRPLGSIAYKLALVASGRADATWTLVPKSEWDVAAGVALVEASGGRVTGLDGGPIVFNQAETKRDGLIAFAQSTRHGLVHVFESWLRLHGSQRTRAGKWSALAK